MGMSWSFRAKLHQAKDETKQRYVEIMQEFTSRKKLKVSEKWRKVRVHVGRKNYALIIFRGKTLSLLLPLNPADYADSKLKFKDLGDKKRYAQTPMLVRLSSKIQMKRVKAVLPALLDEFKLIPPQEMSADDIPYYTTEQLIELGLIKVRTPGTGTGRGFGARRPAQPAAEQQPVAATEAQAQQPVAAAEAAQPQNQAPVRRLGYEVPQSAKRTPKGIINLNAIANHFEAGALVTPQALKDKKLLSPKVNNLKVLGGGNVCKPLHVAACEFSQSAKKALEKAGGKAIVIPTK